MQMCWILGLTGGAGSGKSTAADIFRELGLPIIDADRISRAVTAAIVHSAMKQVLDDEFACAKRSGAPFAVYDCPLLIESPQARARVDRILVIDVPEYLQVERLGTRSGLAPDAALRLIRAQTSRRNRLQAADDVLVNAGTREDFARRVRHYALRLLEAAEKHLL